MTGSSASQISGILASSPSDSTMSSFIKSSTIATAITCKLTRTNFLLWKAQVVPILRGVQLFGYLDGTTPMPVAMVTEGTDTDARQVLNPARATWIVQDQAILGGLLSSMTEDVLPQLIRQIDTSGQLWASLHTMFSAQHRGNSIQIRAQLSNTRKGDMSAAEYYQKMTGLADTMAHIGRPMSDEEVIGYILAGLGPGHSDLFTAITVLSNQRAVTLPEFYSYLISHETQATLMSGTAEFTSSANNVTRQESNAPRRNNSNNGYTTTNNNHRNNYRNGGGGRGRGRGRGRNNGGPRCQCDHGRLQR
ncbi:uncharacterized protein LOC109838115 [Asparagus officinalis]|uniref:uncharacterized protein LOC109838115 n=1 Tax=Asparagus officinalis TaxID=4686 RepID=UPI00098E6690|nr:uncharacterized protein LOC109838115 [Asparagus officinalis]